MYTQCPECGVAFRVTAEVLKQAAGKVRCGGCGIAFNSLEHLSEQKPAAPAPPDVPVEPSVPELTPEEPAELEADTPPQSISAEQSAALLKTLDQLAGSDIRIEDTGVEWRVLDEDDVDDEIIVEETDLIADTGTLKFIVEGDEDALDDEPDDEPGDEPSDAIEEMRFDDNTPLPEDFDFAVEAPIMSAPVEAPEPEPEPEIEEAQVDLALGDPDEWQDLLGDLDEPAVEEDVEEELQENAEEAVEDVAEQDLVSLAEAASEDAAVEGLPDVDTQFAIQAEAMGIDLSGIHERIDEESDDAEPEAEEEPEIVDKTETSIEEDLIAAAFEAEAALKSAEEEPEEDEEQDEQTEDDEDALDELDELDLVEDEEEVAVSEDEQEEEEEIEIDTEIEPVDEEEIEDDVEVIATGFDDKVEQDIGTLSASFDEMDEAEDEPSDEHVIPEMTEEEKTINMMIDQELFNIAVEDEDGFASTIVQIQPNKDIEEEFGENQKQEPQKKEKKEEKEESPLVETIIMEGDFIRGEQDRHRIAAEKAVGSTAFEDPGLSIPLKKTMRGILRRGGDQYKPGPPPSAGMIAGAVALLLLLAVQVMHQSREALATVPIFNQTVGPLYRMIGRPLTPTWNISGWRFEATKGSTEGTDDDGEAAESDEVLTIYSRVGNKSDEALPYPLVHLSLTDRFEEIIGSRVLEPTDYLTENADPRKLVPPGNTFNAVFAINSPSAEATGFKLNVCYRLTGGQLRCAIEDFK